MASEFRNLGIIAKQDDPQVAATLHQLVGFLSRLGHAPWMDAGTRLLVPELAVTAIPLAELCSRCDLVIVVGGDGTLLRAARTLAPSGAAIVGINLGRLGFLTDISPPDIQTLVGEILEGTYIEESRFLLERRLGTPERLGEPALALNDVVVQKWDTARMIEFETYVDDRFVNAQRSDGLILATPTGSTAYALSGGGPLLDTTLNAVLLVPICPHTLSNRPIVISGDSRVEVRLCESDHAHVRVACDGQSNCPIAPGESLFVSKSRHRVRLLHPTGHDHFELLRAKLGWGGHPGPMSTC
jgi:NAD+ kinase